MTKKIAIVISLLLLFISTNVFAGDIPEGIMLGHQKALLIGEITAINEDTISIMPSTVMMGSIAQSEVQIQIFDNYYGTDKKPKTGDYIVAVLLEDNKIDDDWVFKATSDDYKSLNLVSEKYNMVVRYEEYINEGKYFEAQKKIDGEETESIDSNTIKEEDTLKATNDLIQSYITNNQFVLGLILIAFIIIFLFVVKIKKK